MVDLNNNLLVDNHEDLVPKIKFPSIDKFFNKDVATLIEMGYNEDLVKRVYIFIKPESIEQAIIAMSEENSKIQHLFYGSKKSDRCLVCHECKEKHMVPLRRRKEPQPIKKDDDEFDDIDSDIIEETIGIKCLICEELLHRKDKLVNTLDCGHICCQSCWVEYIKTEIERGNTIGIKCVDINCSVYLDKAFITNIIQDESLMEKYERYRKRVEIIGIENAKFCPAPDCDSYLLKSINGKYVKCKNGHHYCYTCLRLPHDEIPCKIEISKDFQLWKRGKVIKQCPRCLFVTEKIEGCNYIHCPSCNFRWCWLCNEEYQPNHFRNGNCGKATIIFHKPKVDINYEKGIFLDYCINWFLYYMIQDQSYSCPHVTYVSFIMYFFTTAFFALVYFMICTENMKVGWSKHFVNLFAVLVSITTLICYQFIVSCVLIVYSLLTISNRKINPVVSLLGEKKEFIDEYDY